jgi:hypothetical protein
MFPERLIARAQSSRDGLSLEVRLPWYRALPLSSVHTVDVSVDGTAVNTRDILFVINGERYRIEELPPRHDAWWYVLDSAFLEVRFPGLEPGAHQVELVLGMLIPYLPVNGAPLLMAEKCIAALSVAEVAA